MAATEFPLLLTGYVAERLVEVYALLTAGGRLSSFRPGSDLDHKDLIIDEIGTLLSIYLQIKCATRPDREGRIVCHVDFPAGRVLEGPRFLYVFCYLDVIAMTLPRIWLVPSADFNRLAGRIATRPGRTLRSFEAPLERPSHWNPYEIDRLQLGPKLLEWIDSAPAGSPPDAGPLLILTRDLPASMRATS